MADGRAAHRDLAFHLGEVVVATHGSVGLDQSLDMLADISLPGKLLGPGRWPNCSRAGLSACRCGARSLAPNSTRLPFGPPITPRSRKPWTPC